MGCKYFSRKRLMLWLVFFKTFFSSGFDGPTTFWDWWWNAFVTSTNLKNDKHILTEIYEPRTDYTQNCINNISTKLNPLQSKNKTNFYLLTFSQTQINQETEE